MQPASPATPTPGPGQAPSGYREVLYWKISGSPSRLLVMNLLSVPLLGAACLVFYFLAISVGQYRSGLFRLQPGQGLLGVAALLLGLVAVLGLHELVHGLAMRLFRARPRYGVLWDKAMLYATAPGFAFPRRQYLAVALAPLAAISLLAVLAMGLLAGTAWVGLVLVMAATNAAGAIGDLWISALVLRYPASTYLIDEQDGVRVLLPEIEARRQDQRRPAGL